MQQYGHDPLSTFGIGQDLSDAQWRGVVRQLLAQGLLQAVGDYGVLSLTEASGAVLAGERKVEHWRTLVRARAIENTVFVLAAGQPGPRYSGHSLVVDPLG